MNAAFRTGAYVKTGVLDWPVSRATWMRKAINLDFQAHGVKNHLYFSVSYGR